MVVKVNGKKIVSKITESKLYQQNKTELKIAGYGILTIPISTAINWSLVPLVKYNIVSYILAKQIIMLSIPITTTITALAITTAVTIKFYNQYIKETIYSNN